MIQFACGNCGKKFKMADEFAGRKGKCKQCNCDIQVPGADSKAVGSIVSAELAVPAKTPMSFPPASANKIVVNLVPPPLPTAKKPSVNPPPAPNAAVSRPANSPPAPPRLTPRTRRLTAEAQQVQTAFQTSSLIQVLRTTGTPPEIYHIQYNVRSLARGPAGQPVPRGQHVVEIKLTRDYPRMSPVCKMLTPIFHPNIEPAMICVGDHWTAAERLVDLIVRIGEIIAYQKYNIKSPLDAEAAMWADFNRASLPFDNRDMHPMDEN